MSSPSPAVVLWLLLLVHALLCSQLLPSVSGQASKGCYPYTPANAWGQVISDGAYQVGGTPRIVGIQAFYSPTMDVLCNFSILYTTGDTGYVVGPAHGYADASCTSQQYNQNTALYKRDWFYTGGYFVRSNSNGMVIYTGFYMKSRCGVEYCGGAGGCPGSIAASANSTFVAFAPVSTGSGYTYQQAYNDTTQVRSSYYPQYADRYMTVITSMSTCWNLTTTYDCSPPGGSVETDG